MSTLKNFDDDESLDRFMEEIRVIRESNFDSWFQRLFKRLDDIKWPTFKRQIIYAVNEETGEVYIGYERRKKPRQAEMLKKQAAYLVSKARVAMMPKTLKIEEIEKGA